MIYQSDYPYPLGRSLPIHSDHFYIEDRVLSGAVVEAAVLPMNQNKALGNTHIRSNHVQRWLWEAYR